MSEKDTHITVYDSTLSRRDQFALALAVDIEGENMTPEQFAQAVVKITDALLTELDKQP